EHIQTWATFEDPPTLDLHRRPTTQLGFLLRICSKSIAFEANDFHIHTKLIKEHPPSPFSEEEQRRLFDESRLRVWMQVYNCKEKDRLVNLPGFHLDVLKPLNLLPFEQKSFSFCIPRDRWDKEFFKLQVGYFEMNSPQGSTLTTNMAGLVDGSTAREEVSHIDCLPVYVKELIAGGGAGAFAKTTVAPLERIKILMQTRTDGFQSLGVYQSLWKVLKHEGVLGFYKGNGASVVRIIPYAALHFMTYERYRGWILDNYSFMGSGPIIDLLAGSASGGTAVICTYPLDLARTKLAYQVTDTRTNFRSGIRSLYPQPAYNGIRDVLTSVYREGGIRGLYRGVGPTLAGILPYAGLKFYIYEVLKLHVPEEHQKSIAMHLSCGAVAGLFGQTFTYPLDVVRRQM
ncbi:hypothetical protein Goarm_008051, partial [Gossypium armourianum]|nr:hypothetical protein [Gossypium armourianum]